MLQDGVRPNEIYRSRRNLLQGRQPIGQILAAADLHDIIDRRTIFQTRRSKPRLAQVRFHLAIARNVRACHSGYVDGVGRRSAESPGYYSGEQRVARAQLQGHERLLLPSERSSFKMPAKYAPGIFRSLHPAHVEHSYSVQPAGIYGNAGQDKLRCNLELPGNLLIADHGPNSLSTDGRLRNHL